MQDDWLAERPLHKILLATDDIARLPGAVVLIVLMGLTALVGFVWQRVSGMMWIGAVYAVFVIADGVLLWSLPRRNISYGPVKPPLLALAIVRLMLALIAAGLIAQAFLSPYLALALLVAIYAVIFILSYYSVVIEPARVKVTRLTLTSPKIAVGTPPLHILQIGDLHMERLTRREHELLTTIAKLRPDVILITGDYLNQSYLHDETALQDARKFLRQLRAPFGVCAVSGSPPIDLPDLVEKIFTPLNDVQLLRNEHTVLNVRGQKICVAGTVCSHNPEIDQQRVQEALADTPAHIFTILLHHAPDALAQAAEAGVDLYLAGHTHGGQIRLPLFGALITGSIHGKRYEMGLYHQQQGEGDTHLYVARGIGMEGLGAPRARFLCSPEVVLWTLRNGMITSVKESAR